MPTGKIRLAAELKLSSYYQRVCFLRFDVSENENSENKRARGVQDYDPKTTKSAKNDLKQHSETYGEQPERWSCCAFRSAQAHEPRLETRVY